MPLPTVPIGDCDSANSGSSLNQTFWACAKLLREWLKH